MTEIEELSTVPALAVEDHEPLTLEQRLYQSEARVRELESAMRAALTEAEQASSAPRRDFWKPLALGACFAALLFAIGIGLLARDRQITGKRYAAALAEVADLRTRTAASETRVYEQNRELADFTNKIRVKDVRIGQLNAQMAKLNQQILLTSKERESLRALISTRLKETHPAPVVVAPFTADNPPVERPARRRRKRTADN